MAKKIIDVNALTEFKRQCDLAYGGSGGQSILLIPAEFINGVRRSIFLSLRVSDGGTSVQGGAWTQNQQTAQEIKAAYQSNPDVEIWVVVLVNGTQFLCKPSSASGSIRSYRTVGSLIVVDESTQTGYQAEFQICFDINCQTGTVTPAGTGSSYLDILNTFKLFEVSGGGGGGGGEQKPPVPCVTFLAGQGQINQAIGEGINVPYDRDLIVHLVDQSTYADLDIKSIAYLIRDLDSMRYYSSFEDWDPSEHVVSPFSLWLYFFTGPGSLLYCARLSCVDDGNGETFSVNSYQMNYRQANYIGDLA